MNRDLESRVRELEEEVDGRFGVVAALTRRVEALEDRVAAQVECLNELGALFSKMTSVLEQRFGAPDGESGLPSGHCGDPPCDLENCGASPSEARIGGDS